MKRILLFFCLSFGMCKWAISQAEVIVYESTIKVASLTEEVLEFGFAEGDEIVFSFREEKGKELSNVEILEWPSSSRFADFKSHSVKEKRITVSHAGIYLFKFNNQSLAGRVCNIRISRIPASSATQKFNSTVHWKSVNDTTYRTEQERYMVRSDTTIHEVMNQIAKVHSTMNLNGNKVTTNFMLPQNTLYWSYYVGVDQSGEQAYQDAAAKLTSSATPIVARIPGYGPLAALALGGISFLTRLQTGEDIQYYLVAGTDNANSFLAGGEFYLKKKGLVINDFARMETAIPGMLYFCLYNDNAITPVNVSLKVTAIVVTQEYGIRDVQRMEISTHEEPYLKN